MTFKKVKNNSNSSNIETIKNTITNFLWILFNCLTGTSDYAWASRPGYNYVFLCQRLSKDKRWYMSLQSTSANVFHFQVQTSKITTKIRQSNETEVERKPLFFQLIQNARLPKSFEIELDRNLPNSLVTQSTSN